MIGGRSGGGGVNPGAPSGIGQGYSLHDLVSNSSPTQGFPPF